MLSRRVSPPRSPAPHRRRYPSEVAVLHTVPAQGLFGVATLAVRPTPQTLRSPRLGAASRLPTDRSPRAASGAGARDAPRSPSSVSYGVRRSAQRRVGYTRAIVTQKTAKASGKKGASTQTKRQPRQPRRSRGHGLAGVLRRLAGGSRSHSRRRERERLCKVTNS